MNGLIPAILTKSRIADITDQEMIDQAVKRNLLKQHKNKVKHHEMDEEARITHKIFRLHNLGELTSNFNEEQEYLAGDAINREVTTMDDSTTSGNLDQLESEELSNDYADESEE